MKILMYHLIMNKNHNMCVSEENFRNQINWLINNEYEFCLVNDLSDELINSQNDKKIMITFDDGYKNTVTCAMDILNEFGVNALMSVCSSYLFSNLNIDKAMHLSNDFATIKQIEKWIESGNEIAAHSFSHANLANIDIDICKEEIVLDKILLEKTFHVPIDSFVYPYGSYNECVEKIVKNNYSFAFTTDSRKKSERHHIKRIGINNEISFENFKKMLGET